MNGLQACIYKDFACIHKNLWNKYLWNIFTCIYKEILFGTSQKDL